MADKADSTSTHDGNALSIKVNDAESGLDNSQESMMLIDPAELESGNTHSDDKPTMPGSGKAPTMASTKTNPKPVKANGAMSEPLVDKQDPPGGKIAEIDNEVDPAAGYLEKEAGMPVINNASLDDDEFDESGDDFPAGDVDDAMPVESEFDDLPSITAEGGDEEFEDLDVGESAPEEVAPVAEVPTEEVADFESAPVSDEAAPLVDVDAVPDTEGSDDLTFAAVNASLHVIRSNRIIASIGPQRARKLGISDVYMGEQFQDVVAHAINTRGLRAGLVKQGFKLSTVKLTSSTATAKVVAAKVEAGMADRQAAIAKRDKAMEQSLAIAAVGINKRYFRDTENSLKAGLVTELRNAGVRNAGTLVSACFAEHGIAYAKAILTLANKIAAMPEEVRNNHAESLDLTSDEDFMPEDTEVEAEFCDDDGDEMEEFEPITSVTAALAAPRNRQYPGALLDPAKKSLTAAFQLLTSNQPLV